MVADLVSDCFLMFLEVWLHNFVLWRLLTALDYSRTAVLLKLVLLARPHCHLSMRVLTNWKPLKKRTLFFPSCTYPELCWALEIECRPLGWRKVRGTRVVFSFLFFFPPEQCPPPYGAKTSRLQNCGISQVLSNMALPCKQFWYAGAVIENILNPGVCAVKTVWSIIWPWPSL